MYLLLLLVLLSIYYIVVLQWSQQFESGADSGGELWVLEPPLSSEEIRKPIN